MKTTGIGTMVFLLAAGLSAAPASAQEWDRVHLQAVPLAEGAWMIHGAGGNHLLLDGEEGPLLVDADYAEVGGKLLALVAELTGAAPTRVIDTHWHFDHVGGNAALRAAGAKVYARPQVRDRMAAGQYLLVIDHEQPPAAPEDLPDEIFGEEIELRQGGRRVVVLPVAPAHTDGDAMVHVPEANLLHTGDVVFFCGYPFIDVNGGGRIDGMIAGVKQAIALCDEETKVIPGHGPLTDRAGLRQYLEMLEDFRAAVAAAKAAGMSLEELLASDATADVDAEWDERMFPTAAFRELVYRTLP